MTWRLDKMFGSNDAKVGQPTEGTMTGQRRRPTTSTRKRAQEEGDGGGTEARGSKAPEGAEALPSDPVQAAGAAGARAGLAVNFRVSQAMHEAVQEAVRDSPIEFGSVSEFYKRAAEHELRRRGLLKTYK